jgi:hypothetical protein
VGLAPVSQLAIKSELDKLSLALDVDTDRLEFLDDVDAADLRGLRVAIYDLFFSQDSELFARLGRAARRLPIPLALAVAERLGPMLTARLAAETPSARGAEIAKRMPTAFAADVCVYLDPRRTRDLITSLPPWWAADVALELARRGDFITMSRFVDFVSDDATRQIVQAIEDEGTLLRVAYYMGSKNRMDHFFRMLPVRRLEALILRVEEESDELLPALLSLLIHVSYGLKRQLGDIAAAQDETVLAGYVRTTQQRDLWPDILPAVAAMSEPARRKVVNLALVKEPSVQESIARAADEQGLWGTVLSLVELMDVDGRAATSRTIAARGPDTLAGTADAALLGEHWNALLDLTAMMPAAKQDELVTIARRLGEVDPDLLARIARGAEQRGFGQRFARSSVEPDAVDRS